MKYIFSLLCSAVAVTQAWISSPSLHARSSTHLFAEKGTVKWFDSTKGFGFIVPDDGSTDVFVHQSAIQAEGFRSLADGEAVEYEVEEDSNGRKKAMQVTGPDGKFNIVHRNNVNIHAYGTSTWNNTGAEVQGAPFNPSDDFEPY